MIGALSDHMNAKEVKSKWNAAESGKHPDKKGYTYIGFLEHFLPNMVVEAIKYDLDRRSIERIHESLTMSVSISDKDLLPEIGNKMHLGLLIDRFTEYLGQEEKDRKPMKKNERKVMDLYMTEVVPAYMNRDRSPLEGFFGIHTPDRATLMFDPSLYPKE